MRAALVAILFAGGCFDPQPLEGAECSPEGLCPSGQVCAADNRCYATPPPIRLRKRIDLFPTNPNPINNFTVGILLPEDAELAEHAADDGSDIAFTQADGATPVDFEIERFDGESGALVAWVRIAELVPGTPIFLLYGGADPPPARDPAAAWDANRFEAIWHLGDQGDGTYPDSTLNERDGTAALNVRPDPVAGIAGEGLAFNGIDDVIAMGGAPLGDELFQPVVFSMWIKRTEIDFSGTLVSLVSQQLTAQIDRQNGAWSIGADDIDPMTPGLVAGFGPDREDEWVLLTGAVEFFIGEGGLRLRSLVNGAEVTNFSGQLTCTELCRLGPAAFGPFSGIVDEIRVWSTSSEVLLFTHFENLTDPASFFSVGPQEASF